MFGFSNAFHSLTFLRQLWIGLGNETRPPPIDAMEKQLWGSLFRLASGELTTVGVLQELQVQWDQVQHQAPEYKSWFHERLCM